MIQHGSISKIIIEVLTEAAEFVFLMGSAETPRFHQKSDVDIAAFWKHGCTEEKIKTLWSVLEQRLGRDVDLVSLNGIDVIFGRQVLENGRILFVHSDGELLNWKMQQMSQYPDFKTSRKVIELNILNRKKYV